VYLYVQAETPLGLQRMLMFELSVWNIVEGEVDIGHNVVRALRLGIFRSLSHAHDFLFE
jgi:hypothetical protein